MAILYGGTVVVIVLLSQKNYFLSRKLFRQLFSNRRLDLPGWNSQPAKDKSYTFDLLLRQVHDELETC